MELWLVQHLQRSLASAADSGTVPLNSPLMTSIFFASTCWSLKSMTSESRRSLWLFFIDRYAFMI